MEQKEAPSKSGCRVNNCYHTGTKMESEEEFMPTSSARRDKERELQNEIAQMRKTLDQEICLRTMREQELRIKEEIVEKLQKSLSSEKYARARMVEESSVVKNACNELEERLNELLVQMRRALGNKMLLLGVETKGNQLREKKRVIDGLDKAIEHDKQARSTVKEASNQARNTCSELKERWEDEHEKVEQTTASKISLRNTKEQELTEMRTIIDELETTLREEQPKIDRLEEELRQERAACNTLEERLNNELVQMQMRLENEISFRCAREQELRESRNILDQLQSTFEEQQLEKTSVQNELNQTRRDYNEIKEKLENQTAQMQRTLENEIYLRSTKEQQLKKKEENVDELAKTLAEEQLRRTVLEEELRQARIDGVEQKEGMENELSDMQRTLNIEKRLYETREAQLRRKDTCIDELQQRLSEEEKIKTRVEEELSQARAALTQVRERLENELAHVRGMHEQQLNEKETTINEQLRTLGEQQRAFEDDLNLTERYYRDQIETKDSALREQRQQMTALENRLGNLQRQIEDERNRQASTERELEATLSAAQNALTEYQRPEPRDWIIQREEVVLSERVLGRGGWGKVFEGTFRSCQVAVKEMHEVIISEHNRGLFEREIRIASFCRHPNLLQFIGATNDDGSPLFVTELLDTSLRHLLSQRALHQDEKVELALDVAKGLNYLHLNRPQPVIHRDISSANVLLWRLDERWRAKLSDYGSANFLRLCTTVNPGAIIYSAPEALTADAQQSTKVDVYSFGVLLCEMCIRQLPSHEELRNQIRQVTSDTLRRLIKRCVRRNSEERPAISDVINTLAEPGRTTGVLSHVRTLFRL